MRIPRFYCPELTQASSLLTLPDKVHRHAIQVLRLKQGDKMRLFDGLGLECHAELVSADKRTSAVQLGERESTETSSPLSITLIQGISKGDRMDIALQKAVELGVNKIIPVVTERCNVQLNHQRSDKKWAHWQGVMISACEQSGRNSLPELSSVMTLQAALNDAQNGIILSPIASSTLTALSPQQDISIAIGPEGGFSDDEMMQAEQSGFQSVRFGPRILRTETAAIAVISALQTLWGDLA